MPLFLLQGKSVDDLAGGFVFTRVPNLWDTCGYVLNVKTSKIKINGLHRSGRNSGTVSQRG